VPGHIFPIRPMTIGHYEATSNYARRGGDPEKVIVIFDDPTVIDGTVVQFLGTNVHLVVPDIFLRLLTKVHDHITLECEEDEIEIRVTLRRQDVAQTMRVAPKRLKVTREWLDAQLKAERECFSGSNRNHCFPDIRN